MLKSLLSMPWTSGFFSHTYSLQSLIFIFFLFCWHMCSFYRKLAEPAIQCQLWITFFRRFAWQLYLLTEICPDDCWYPDNCWFWTLYDNKLPIRLWRLLSRILHSLFTIQTQHFVYFFAEIDIIFFLFYTVSIESSLCVFSIWTVSS